MTEALEHEGKTQLTDESLVPLISRRRSSWSTSSDTGLDIEEGGGPTSDSDGAGVGEAPGDSISVRVKTAGDGRVYKVTSALSATVTQLKAEVSRVIGAEGKYLRLISSGKMLNPDDSLVKDFGLSENCYVHCVVTAAPPRLQLPPLTPEQTLDEEGEDDDQSELRGFDELRNNGMTRAEVTAIRSYFSAEVLEFSRTLPDTGEDQTDWDRQVLAEEAWIRVQSPTSEFALNVSMARRGDSAVGMESGSPGDTRDFMFGFAMGSLFGYIMLLWVWEGTVPRRQKLGILAGVTFRQTMRMIQDAVGTGNVDEG